jgi:hypothetical protein
MSAIEKLDRPNLFSLGEDARLVYALNVAGGAFYSDVMVEMIGVDDGLTCPPGTGMAAATIGMVTTDAMSEAALRRVLGDWMEAKKREYGEARFESKMKNAANELNAAGLSAKWPTKVILSGGVLGKPNKNGLFPEVKSSLRP